MRGVARFAMIMCCSVAVAAFAGASAGCSTSAAGGSGWKDVATAHVSGAAPARVNLGMHRLERQVRLTFELSGPPSPRVRFTFVVFSVRNGGDYARTVTPQADPQVFAHEKAITLSPLAPGVYRIFFAQAFAAADAPGYDAKLTVSTSK